MKKILIIEDHADMRELLTWQIELMGFVPIPARRGREGVERALSRKTAADHHGYHDAGHGWVGGGAGASRECRDQGHSDIGRDGAVSRLRSQELVIEAGCNGYIVKPFTFQELQGKVRELIPAASTTYPL